MQSTTKYLGGHSDVIGGAVMTNDEAWAEHLRFQIKAGGAVPGPMDCFLVLRSTKTLHVCGWNGIAGMRVRSLGTFTTTPRWGAYAILVCRTIPVTRWPAGQMRDFGGMISFSLADDDVDKAVRLMAGMRLIALAESLGGVESLIEHPATMDARVRAPGGPAEGGAGPIRCSGFPWGSRTRRT